MICWYCNKSIDYNAEYLEFDCELCDVQYYIDHEKSEEFILEYIINFDNRINFYAKCHLFSGTAQIYFWSSIAGNFCESFQIFNYKWTSSSKDEFLEFIKSLLVFS